MSRTLLPSLALALAACAHAPGVASDELQLKKVVVYRNGVGYFERAGEVDGDTVKFRVRTDHVGDFLATLAVMEHGGSSVRSAAFPIHVEKPAPGAKDVKWKRPLEEVTLALDGKGHALRVGYVAEQPVWRPSYRLVFENGQPTLQAWGIVQNLSGEDWNDVELSLVAGAPIAFQATLGTPVTPARPIVDDRGETISSVPQSETQLAQQPAPAATPSPPPEAEPMPPPAASAAPAPGMPSRMSKRARRYEDAEPGAGDEARSRSAPESQVPRNLSLMAAQSVEAGTTRYDLPNRVTIPDDSATMVLLLAKPVPGEEAYLFAPDGGVPDSATHPFHVARFKNDTAGILERGPIAVFEKDAFLGQGVMEPLAAGAQTTVPFALERALAVDRDTKWEQRDARLARIENGNLMLERDQVLKTTWRVRNGGDKEAKVIIRQPRQSGMRLHEAPKGTEDLLGENKALVPVVVPARGSAEAKVDERRAYTSGADWLSAEAGAAVKAYLADKRADPAVASALTKAWAVRETLRTSMEGRQKLASENAILSAAAEQSRASLRAIARNKGGSVEALRTKLTGRLTDLEKQLAEVQNKLVELDLEVNELRVRFSELVRDIKLAEPLPVV